MKAASFVLLISFVVIGFYPPLAQSPACMMVPLGYDGTVSQDAQKAILVKHGDNEELILRINYKIDGETPPDQIAWIVTVPNEPTQYKLADNTLFDEVGRWSFNLADYTPPRWMPSIGCSGSEIRSDSVSLGNRALIGPYDIQPVRATGMDALNDLNQWLNSNQFPTETPDHMKYFVENDFTFLCIKVVAPADATTISQNGDLPPLHMSFKSKDLYYPLKFSSRQGQFSVSLSMITDQPLSNSKLAKVREQLESIRMNNDNVHRVSSDIPEDLVKQLNDCVFASAINDDDQRWFVNHIWSHRVNDQYPIADWKQDILIPTDKNADSYVIGMPWSYYKSLTIFSITFVVGIAIICGGARYFYRRATRNSDSKSGS